MGARPVAKARMQVIGPILALVLWALASPTTRAVGLAVPLPNPSYKFVTNTKPWVRVRYPDRESIGKLDRRGNFLPDPWYVDVRGWESVMPATRWLNSRVFSSVYEFRSDRLIPGALDQKGNFIPRLGGKVISFNNYCHSYSQAAPPIWNLPGYFRKTVEGAASAALPAPKSTSAVRRAVTLPKSDYRFVPDTTLHVAVQYGPRRDIGKLDARGNFLPDRRWIAVQKGHPMLRRSRLINSPASSSVYEFRSDRLIPGSLDKEGNFIPTLGGEVISFKDYRYSDRAPKIWNLPGRFVKSDR